MFKIPNSKRALAGASVSVIGALGLGFVSDFVLRISNLGFMLPG
jgi:hypothetical protein